jgi:hypothetical protein
VANATKGKIGPSRLLEIEWVKDSLLKENSFGIWVGSGMTGDQQWTFHRPIGETPMDSTNEWVATPTRDIGFLLHRKESEELSSWKRRSELAKRQAVLRARTGRRLAEDQTTEVWAFDGAPAIQPTIRACMTAAKAASAPESAWLSYADQAVQVAEQSFKEALRTQAIPADWVAENPRPAYETMGGPLGDVHQKPVSYLTGLSFNAAKDKVLRVIIGVDSNESDDDEDDDGEADEHPGADGN